MTEQEIREQLRKIGATDAQFDRWLAGGLPHSIVDDAMQFDHAQVAVWLLERGIAEPIEESQTQTIVRTIPEVASHFDVSKNAVREWVRDPEFPGRVGERGRQNGRFPLEAIADWKAARDGTREANQVGNSARERKWNADAEIREMELARMRGELIEVDVVAREMTRAIHNAKSIINEIPDELFDRLPPKFRARYGAKIREWLIWRINQAYDVLEEMKHGEDDDGETTPQGESDPPADEA